MMSKNRMYEMMTRELVGKFIVRVWSHSNSFQMGPDVVVRDTLLELKRNDESGYFRTGVEPINIADALDRLGEERIMAYEILDEHLEGAIVYPDWK